MSDKASVDYKALLKDAFVSLEKLKARVAALEAEKSDPIAVVGMACRFPGKASNVQGFWELLRQGESAITEVPASRWDADAYFDSDPDAPGKIYSRWGGFVENTDSFEPQFFGISPREAVTMDPQQRLLMEVTWEALEDAALSPTRLVGSATGVFVGISFSEYGAIMAQEAAPSQRDLYSATGTHLSISAGRLSYSLGLQGPSMAVDTACSSSLLSVHLAIQSLRTRECNLALAGGVSLMLSAGGSVLLCRGHMLSFDGRCKTFDAAADGYVRGEGCGIVVLKRLSDALKDGDRVLAVLLGSAANQDGRSSGLTAPNGAAQEALIQGALRNAGVEPTQVSYVEAHGTGTPLGDPIEMRAIDAVYGAGRAGDSPLRVGSVKTNIGHLEPAAGIAALMKVIMSLQQRQIPAHLNVTNLSPRIPWHEMPIEIPTTRMEWTANGTPRKAGVSAFGFSGTNVHVIVQEAPAAEASVPDAKPQQLLTLSARTDRSLREAAGRFERHFSNCAPEDFANSCFTANHGRARLDRRLAIVTDSADDARQKLAAFAAGAETAGVIRANTLGDKPKIAFLFTGQGSQYPDMGRQLFDLHPVFRQSMEECDAILGDINGRSLLSVIYPAVKDAAADALLQQTGYAQPALFALEVSLARLWKSWGVEPAAVLGHSVGEYAAACVAGVFSVNDGLTLISARGRLMQALPPGGSMLAVSADEDVVRAAVSGNAPTVAIAALNAPQEIVLSGNAQELAGVERVLREGGIPCTWLNVSHAFHSTLMEPMLGEFAEVARSVHYHRPSLRIVSNVTAQPASDSEPMNADYWIGHVLAPVRFRESIESVRTAGYDLFVEVGPHPVLLGLGRKGDVSGSATWLPSLRRGKPDWPQLLNTLGELFVRGVDFDADALHRPGRCRKVSLPSYPFDRERYWFEQSRRSRSEMANRLHPLLDERVQSPLLTDVVFSTRLSADEPEFATDHVVFDMPVFPATGYLEMARTAARLATGAEGTIEDVSIEEPLILEQDVERVVQVAVSPERDGRSEVRIFSRVATATEDPWTRHAAGYFRAGVPAVPTPRESLNAIRERCASELDVAGLYENMREQGMNYGPAFRGMEQLWHGHGEAIGRLRLPDVLTREKEYGVHPAYLDAALQVIAAAVGGGTEDDVLMPVGIQAVRIYRQPPACGWTHARLIEATQQTFRLDLSWFDDDGEVVLELLGVVEKRASVAALKRISNRTFEEWLHEIEWQPRPLEAIVTAEGKWLVLGGSRDLSTAVADTLRDRGAECVLVRSGSEYQDDGGPMISDLSDELHVARLLAAAASPLDGVVYLAGDGQRAQSDSRTLDALEGEVEDSCKAVLALVKALAGHDGAAPRLFIVTRGAQAAGNAPHPPDVAQAPLWGLGRVIANELPHLRCTLIDLDPLEDEDAAPKLVDDLCSGMVDDQIAIRGGVRFVARLVRRRRSGSSDQKLPIPASPSFQLSTAARGVLDTLVIEPRERHVPGPGQVEIELVAAGLNFRDVLNALGMYPGDPGPMGGECAGRIVSVGEGVTDLQIGDEVLCLARASFSRFVITHSKMVARKPATLTFEQAATVPMTFLTAHYGLHGLAQIKPGDRVLVHAATGGVGMAAVQIARRAGAEVYGTAGTPEKRAFARSLGCRAVFSSRRADFVDDLRAATGGHGVDIVLNALTGEFIPASLAVLAPGGRFLEIGKAEIWEPSRVSAIRDDVTYRPFDLGDVMRHDLDHIAEMFTDVMDGIAEGALKPLPLRVFPIEEAISAYRFMAQARHIGKIVLSTRHLLGERAADVVRTDASYLVTGGCGGLGLVVAEWLARRGAGRVVLTGRSSPGAAAREAIDRIRSTSTQVDVVLGDIARADDVARVVAASDQPGRPLRGIVHAAGVLDDGLIVEQTWERTAKVLAPKLRGAWLLHEATATRALDFFALFSSAASALGSAGQSNYAAANAFLDALAHYRRAQGAHALSINWGAWSEVGMAARLASKDQARMAGKGIGLIAPDAGVAVFEQLIGQQAVETVVLPVRWGRVLRNYPIGSVPPFLEVIAEESRQKSEAAQGAAAGLDACRQIKAAAAADRPALVRAFLCAQLARVLGLEPSHAFSDSAEFSSLGLDSLMGVELRNSLTTLVGRPLSASLIFDYPTIEALSRYLAAELQPASDETATEAPVTESVGLEDPETLLANLDQLPDSKIDELLAALGDGPRAV